MKNAETKKMREEIKKHLTEGIIPFWKGMRDDEFGEIGQHTSELQSR